MDSMNMQSQNRNTLNMNLYNNTQCTPYQTEPDLIAVLTHIQEHLDET